MCVRDRGNIASRLTCTVHDTVMIKRNIVYIHFDEQRLITFFIII